MSIKDKLLDIATDGIVGYYSFKDKADDTIHKKKYDKADRKRRSLSYDREIDEETGCGILEVTTEDGLVTAFESMSPVIRVSGKTAKSIMIEIDDKKGKNKLGKIISLGGIGFALITSGVGAVIGAVVAVGGVYLSANNQIKNSDKYNATIVSEECIIFRLKEFKK